MRENSWLSYTEEDDKNVEVLAQEYKEFLSKCKTERECTQYFICLLYTSPSPRDCS